MFKYSLFYGRPGELAESPEQRIEDFKAAVREATESRTSKERELQVDIGDTIDDMGRRFVDAWHRAEQGELTPENAERHVGFETFETFSRIMTPRRIELLRRVHRHPARSIRALALALGRDYRRVHEDVEALTQAGLLDRDEKGLHADYETVKIETRVVL